MKNSNFSIMLAPFRSNDLIVQFWNSHQNIVRMLEDRGHVVVTPTYEKKFPQFKQQCLTSLNHTGFTFVMHELTIVAKQRKGDMAPLPRIEQTIAAFIAQVKKQEPPAENRQDQTITFADGTPLNRCSADDVVVLFAFQKDSPYRVESLAQLFTHQQIIDCRHMILVLHYDEKPGKPMTSASMKMMLQHQFDSNLRLEWFTMISKTYNITHHQSHGRYSWKGPNETRRWLQEHEVRLEQLEAMTMKDAMVKYYDYHKGDMVQIEEPNGALNFVSIGVEK